MSHRRRPRGHLPSHLEVSSDADPSKLTSFKWGCGVRRVDFLKRHVVLEALVKGCNGMWKMKAEYLDWVRGVV
jgi:hypothetical protein